MTAQASRPPGTVSDQRDSGIALIAGARPNFMKAAPVLRALSERGLQVRLVHTGQHYDSEMSEAFFTDLALPEPDVHLGVGSGSHAEQTGRIMVKFERYVEDARPRMVVVVGDVNSTLACAVVAAKAGVRVAHVEAGLRSFDRSMPEEINRLVTDGLSDLLFTTSEDANENLRREGHAPQQIFFVGNTMIDTLLEFRDRVAGDGPLRALGIEPRSYLLVTLHRPSNVDEPDKLAAILRQLGRLRAQVVFPIHPRTRAVIERNGYERLLQGLVIIPPASYVEFLRLQTHAAAVLTDSGGIQEETTVLNVPCLTFRDNTERPVTITHGTNRLIGSDPSGIDRAVEDVLSSPRTSHRRPPLWDGKAAQRIAAVLESAV